MRLVLSSEDGKTFHSDNMSFDFRVKLNRSIQLDGYWVVALTELSVSDLISHREKQELFIFSNICQNSIVADTEQPLLRRVVIENNQKNVIYENPYYIPVKLGDLQHVHVYITESKGEKSSFLKKKLTVTLH